MDADDALPAALASRKDDARKIARALARKQVVTLDEVVAETGLEPGEARALLREFAKAGLCTMQLTTSGGCHGRREGPQFFYARVVKSEGT